MRSIGVSEIIIVLLVVLVVILFLLNRATRPSDAAPRFAAPRPPLDAATIGEITELLRRERRIEAIKVLREATGLGLRDSKNWIDEWDVSNVHASSGPAPAPTTAGLDTLEIEARAVAEAAGEIAAIKHVRTRTGWGLAEAKAYVDRLSAR